MVSLAITTGLGIGLLLVPWSPRPSDAKPPLPEIRLLDGQLPPDDEATKLALARVRRFVSGDLQLVLPDGQKRSFRMGRFGVQIDKVRLAQLVRDARDPESPLIRAYRSRGQALPLVLPVATTLDTQQALDLLLVLKDELDRLPADARLDLEQRKLAPEVVGRLLDIDGSLREIEAALESGKSEAKLVFEERRPRRIAAELAGVKFDQVLGYFETVYNTAAQQRARTFNLRLAASKLDGTVLMPGEVFDFNETVGPRDEANGYKVATVIAEGELVDGIGGGTCQISGTLHGAVLFSGLEIVERYPHTRPSSYIKMGLDATVVYPTINFRFKNPFSFPVVLHESVKNGVVRGEILGSRRPYTVTLIRRIDSVVPYEEVERPDPKIPNGIRILGQRGVPGFKLHRYRILREGNHATRERFDEVYPPTHQIVLVGSGDMPADSLKAKDDPHPEYLADELLVMTQGPGTTNDKGEPGVSEQREPGDFGRPGWTEKAGMPFWHGKDTDKEESSRSADSGEKEKKKRRRR